MSHADAIKRTICMFGKAFLYQVNLRCVRCISRLAFLLFFFSCPFPLFTVQCNATLSAMEDVVESPDPASSSSPFSPLECTYSITVYAGYGVEIQVSYMIIIIIIHLIILLVSNTFFHCEIVCL